MLIEIIKPLVGLDCVVILPENVRDRLKQKLLTLCQLYDIEISE